LKTKIFLSIAFVTIFFSQFNFYSKTYVSITTDHFVSEYQLILHPKITRKNSFSQKPPADYPFFYIFDDNYVDNYRNIMGYFTAYFPLSTEAVFPYLKFSAISSSPIEIKNICLHNTFKEKCWNAQEIPQFFNIHSNDQKLTLEYKDDFQTLHQTFLIPNFSKKITVFLFIGFLSFLYFQRKKVFSFLFQKKPETIFLWMGLIFGISTCFINPPFQVPDEIYHLSHAVYLTQNNEISSNSSCTSFPMNAIISGAEVHLHYRHTPLFLKEKLDYFSQLPPHPQFTEKTGYNKHHSMFPYIPSAIGVYIGKIFELSWLNMTYLARITNLLSWLLLGYLAIRFIPIGKWLLCLIALSPMSVFQAASISIDSLTNGLSFLLIALIFKFIFKQQLIVLISILIVSIFVAFTKIPYLILLSLIFLFFTQRPLKLPYVLSSIFIAVLTFSGFLWIFFNQTSSNFNSIAFQQIYSIIQQPIEYIQLIIETIRLYGLSLIKEWVGIFGWLEIHLPMWFIVLHIIMLSLYVITDSSLFILNKLSKVLIFMVFILGVLGVFTTLYIIETPLLKLPYIDGLQGRYFIPLGILPFLLLQNKWISFSNNTFSILSIIYIPFSLIFMLIAIYKYYPS
jgi:uncharacterized membrane protein